MRVAVLALAPFLLTVAPAHAAGPHSGHIARAPAGVVATAKPGVGATAADLHFDPAEMARARQLLRIENGGAQTHALILDRLETTFDKSESGYLWDAQGWVGGDVNRFWWKSEGHGKFGGRTDDVEVQALYSRAVTPYFDLQTGVRQSWRPEGDRTDLVLGLQGLAPYWFEIDSAFFLSNKGDLTARTEAEVDLRLTQNLILQPRIEANFAARDIPEFEAGAGLSDIEIGARLRYQIDRRFAPYVGVEWSSAFGATRDFVRATGGDPEATKLIVGVRSWF